MLSQHSKEYLESIFVVCIAFVMVGGLYLGGTYIESRITNSEQVEYENLELRIEKIEKLVLPAETLQGTDSYQTYQYPSPPPPAPPIYEDEN